MAKAAMGVAMHPSFFLGPTTTSSSLSHTSSFICFSPSHAFVYLARSNPNPLLYTPVNLSSASSFDLTQPHLFNSGGGAGNGFGDRVGGAIGGGGDNNSKGAGGSDFDGDKRKMALSMCQTFTLAYAALLGSSGVMGYLNSGSQKSL